MAGLGAGWALRTWRCKPSSRFAKLTFGETSSCESAKERGEGTGRSRLIASGPPPPTEASESSDITGIEGMEGSLFGTSNE